MENVEKQYLIREERERGYRPERSRRVYVSGFDMNIPGCGGLYYGGSMHERRLGAEKEGAGGGGGGGGRG